MPVDPDAQKAADHALARAIRERGATDPREPCRALLKELRARDRSSYERAVAHYQDTLVPSIAHGQADPLAAWLDYARLLASLIAPGRAVQVDGNGNARDYLPPVPPDHLVLHLPDDPSTPALALALPAQPSPAQQATYDLLVAGRVS